MVLDDGKANVVKKLDTGVQATAVDGGQNWVENQAQWNQADFQLARASNDGRANQYERQVEQLFGKEDDYVDHARSSLRSALNETLPKGHKLSKDSTFEQVEDKVAEMVAKGFSARSTWSQEYKNEVMDRLKKGNPDMNEDMAKNKQAVYDALIAGDRLQAVQVLGEAGKTASGRTLEDAVNRYQYRDMLLHGIKKDTN